LKKNLPIEIGYSHVEISRRLAFLNLNIYVLKPYLLLGLNEAKIFSLRNNLSKELALYFSPREINLKLVEIIDQDTSAIMLADFVRLELEKRIPFRRVIKSALLRAQNKQVLGVRIQVSGRLNGAEIARTEWISSGKMPLHTLRASIDYCNSTAH
jgi:small subunit ribosomal protein S3